MPPKKGRGPQRPIFDGIAALKAALEVSRSKEDAAAAKDGGNPPVSFAMAFAKRFGQSLAENLETVYPGIQSGETPSAVASGYKRVDLNYSTRKAGLCFMISFKSVHRGEAPGGNAKFSHNMKRNDEELRVEATAHHLRQPYSVLTAVVTLPFEACFDAGKDGTSSFAKWVRYLWKLKGRTEPEDPPDRFELVFVQLYARDGSELDFYEVGGPNPCPRSGRPTGISAEVFLQTIEQVYRKRNAQDFHFQGEEPDAKEPEDED